MPFKLNPITGKLDYYPKLDDCSAPDDNLDLNASASKHGLLLKLGGGTTNFLRADGTWNAPTGAAHAHDGDTLQLDGINSDGGAFAFTTSGAITFNQSIIVDGGDIGVTGDTNIIQISVGNVQVNGTLLLAAGALVNEFSIDGTLAGNSDSAVPTEQAVKTYVDGHAPSAHVHDGDTLQLDGISSDGGAFAFTTSGAITFSQSLIVDGGNIGITADADLIGLANAALTVNGTLTATGIITGATHSKLGDTDIYSEKIEINTHGSGNRFASINLIGDDTYTSFGLQIIRSNAGANTQSLLNHRGTGAFAFNAQDAAEIMLLTDNTQRLTISATGAILVKSGATLGFAVGTTINEFSTDDTLGGDSDDAVPTEQAVKAYVDANSGGSTIVTGSYTGNGSTSYAITGLGITPKYVAIWRRDVDNNALVIKYESTDTMVDDNVDGLCQRHLSAGGHALKIDCIISMSSGQFTVDDKGSDTEPNTNGVVFNYIAIG